MKVLKPDEFGRFRVLRECRKEIARQDAVPPYVLFLDGQLAEMAKFPELTEAAMKKIEGVGERKLEKYGTRLVAMFGEKMKEAAAAGKKEKAEGVPAEDGDGDAGKVEESGDGRA